MTQMGLKNVDGVDIKDVWKNGIRTYLGMTFNGFPNCFMVYSPHGSSSLISHHPYTNKIPAPTALSNGPTIIEAQSDFVMSTITKLESENARYFEATAQAEDEWDGLIDTMANYTLLPLTNSWWNASNIPGKKPQQLTHPGGIQMYEKQCLEKLEGWQGFNVVYGEGGKKEANGDAVKAEVK
jgi:hypothetical protein